MSHHCREIKGAASSWKVSKTISRKFHTHWYREHLRVKPLHNNTEQQQQQPETIHNLTRRPVRTQCRAVPCQPRAAREARGELRFGFGFVRVRWASGFGIGRAAALAPPGGAGAPLGSAQGERSHGTALPRSTLGPAGRRSSALQPHSLLTLDARWMPKLSGGQRTWILPWMPPASAPGAEPGKGPSSTPSFSPSSRTKSSNRRRFAAEVRGLLCIYSKQVRQQRALKYQQP